MSASNPTRDRRPAKPPLLPGDVVTLKTLPGLPFTVADQQHIEAGRYLITRLAQEGQVRVERTVHEDEILSAMRFGPLTVDAAYPPAPEAEAEPGGEPGAPPPPVSVAQAAAADEPEGPIAWGPEDARGNFDSKCGRFRVVAVGGNYTAYDVPNCAIRSNLPLRSEAVAWCELQAAKAAGEIPPGVP